MWLFEFGRKESVSPTMRLWMCTSLLQEYYWEAMSVMKLNIHIILFKWTDLDLVTTTIYALHRYVRPTMKMWHFGVTSLNLKPLGECLTNNAFFLEIVLKDIHSWHLSYTLISFSYKKLYSGIYSDLNKPYYMLLPLEYMAGQRRTPSKYNTIDIRLS